MKIAIHDVRVVDPFQSLDQVQDLLIEDGLFVERLSGPADKEISGQTLLAFPGFIDVHTHLRDPGQTYKEDIVSGTKAASKGGFVLVCAMPNTTPICDQPEIVRYMIEKAEGEGFAQVLPIAAATMGEKGQSLSSYAELKAAGAGGVTDDGRPIANADILLQCLQEASKYQLPVIDHPEDSDLARGKAMNAGPVAEALGLKGMPRAAESICVARDILLAMEYNLPIHLCHLSCKESVDLLRWAKQQGAPVTADTCPHYFLLTEEAVKSQGANAKMYPPLRREEDRSAILDAVKEGTIEMISTDHAPHSQEEKGSDIALAKNGIVGLEHAFALSYDCLYLQEGLDLSALVARFTQAPAELLSLGDRSLRLGNPANLCLFDPHKSEIIDPDTFASKARNTPFAGRTTTGSIAYTFWKGKITYERTSTHD
ncbi:MAG: dihydroorotase [Eubacteriales bacterium]|nr:dihydroorotase [Clostridiales bacterium]MDY5836122.1 dihydroorotase [Eubacteriales bacterium]